MDGGLALFYLLSNTNKMSQRTKSNIWIQMLDGDYNIHHTNGLQPHSPMNLQTFFNL